MLDTFIQMVLICLIPEQMFELLQVEAGSITVNDLVFEHGNEHLEIRVLLASFQ